LLDTPGRRAIYNNLKPPDASQSQVRYAADSSANFGQRDDPTLELALAIDRVVRDSRPAGWRGVEPRERVIKQALYELLKDVDEVERIFLIIREQAEY
jgi:type I restriction enzyme R subunit